MVDYIDACGEGHRLVACVDRNGAEQTAVGRVNAQCAVAQTFHVEGTFAALAQDVLDHYPEMTKDDENAPDDSLKPRWHSNKPV